MTARVYGDLETRASNDLDILVSPRDVERAAELLERNGFRNKIGLNSPAERAFFARTASHHAFLRRRDGLVVEIHRYCSLPVFAVGAVDVACLAGETVKVEGMSFPVLPAGEVVCLIAAHLVQHGFEGLRFVCDLHENRLPVQG